MDVDPRASVSPYMGVRSHTRSTSSRAGVSFHMSINPHANVSSHASNP